MIWLLGAGLTSQTSNQPHHFLSDRVLVHPTRVSFAYTTATVLIFFQYIFSRRHTSHIYYPTTIFLPTHFQGTISSLIGQIHLRHIMARNILIHRRTWNSWPPSSSASCRTSRLWKKCVDASKPIYICICVYIYTYTQHTIISIYVCVCLYILRETCICSPMYT